MRIEQRLIEEFERNGAVCLRGLFGPEWIGSAARGIEKNMAAPSAFGEQLKGKASDACYFDDYCNWKRILEFRDYAYNSPAANIAGQLLKSKHVSFYHEHVLVKEPGADKETPWHHDQSYYPIDGDKVCSIWMPVDPVPKETCVRFAAGSHKGPWYLPRKFATTLPYEIQNARAVDRKYEPVPDVAESHFEILTWDLQPGDCIVFHMRTLHGAPGNQSATQSRRVLSTRWLGDDAVIAQRPWIVSPPIYGGLKPGDAAVSEDFPIVWRAKMP